MHFPGWLRFLWDTASTLAAGMTPWGGGLRRTMRLLELDVHWLPDPAGSTGRRMTGLGFLCPLHGDHRVWLYFRKPLDDGEPVISVPLYDVENGLDDDVFAGITVTDIRNENRPIVYACGARFWIAGGYVELATR